MRICVLLYLLLLPLTAAAEQQFTEEELSVTKFWEDMGPTLRDEGIEAYAIRYHEDFTHWDVMGTGRMSDKESAVGFWSKFHQDGHRITCTFVEPTSIRIINNKAIARLTYEQTNTYADGRVDTNAFRMVSVFERYGDTWQTLDSNMIRIASNPSHEGDATEYAFHCPQS